MLLLVLGINLVLIRPKISEIQLQKAEKLIQQLTSLALRLRPGLKATCNLHQLVHIPDDIRAHGPVYFHWCFVGERTGKTMKNAKNNGKVVEITAMNAHLRASTASLVQQHLSSYADPLEDYQAIAKLVPFHSGFLRNC